MKRTSTLLSATALAGFVAACATGGGMYSQPYAQLSAERISPTQDTRPAIVMRVDDQMWEINRDDPIPPGRHKIEVSIPGAPGMSNPDRDVLEIDAKPCMRYYFSARRSSRTARDWEGFVSSVEPIGECRRKFPDAAY
jgi:hypothetical protein